MNESKRRVPTLIFNVLFALICAAAIVMYFISPVWELELKAKIPTETLQKALGDSAEDLNIRETLGKEEVEVTLELSINSADLAAAVIQWDTYPMVEKIADKNVDSVLEQLSGDINAIAKAMTRNNTKETVKSQVNNQLREFFASSGEDKTDEEINSILSNAGITDEYIDQQASRLVDSVFENGSTIDAVCDESVAIAEDVIAQLKENDPEQFSDLELTEEIETAIRESVSSAISDYADENGNIDPNDAINAFLLNSLNSLRENADSQGSPGDTPSDSEQTAPSEEPTVIPDVAAAKNYVCAAADSNSTDSVSDEELRAETKQFLMDMVYGEDSAMTETILTFSFLGIGILLAISLLSWVYLLLKIICKTFMKNCYVKIKAPVIFGWFLFLFLMLLPNLALNVLPGMLTNTLPADILNIFAMIAGTTFFSSAMYAAIAAAALIVLWIPYRIICKPKNN